jgi:hypothetical protein
MTFEQVVVQQKDKTERGESKHQPAECVHRDEREWETIRWPGQTGKMLFHPRPERPTEPNAGIVRYEAGGHHPLHHHEFAQVWYILSGEFRIGGKLCGPGTMLFYPDPHYEDELSTETGGEMVFVQYPGPTTGGLPIYDGRFNMAQRKAIDAERTDV